MGRGRGESLFRVIPYFILNVRVLFFLLNLLVCTNINDKVTFPTHIENEVSIVKVLFGVIYRTSYSLQGSDGTVHSEYTRNYV